MKKISSTNTKAEILSAFDELLEELKTQNSENTTLQRALEKKQQLVTKAENQSKKGGASENIQVLRDLFNEQLDQIESGIAKEQAYFGELQEAISIEKKVLEDLYKVKAEAESLEALIFTHNQAKERLNLEIEERKEIFKQEIADTKTNWQREQESYKYDLGIARRNEEDAFKQKKAEQEKQLAQKKSEFESMIVEREKVVAEQEEQLENLSKKVSGFDALLTTAVSEKEKAVTENLTKEFEYRQKLDTKELESDLKLHKQEIESMKVKIKEQQELINTLTSKTDNAAQQVKDIAVKAIENSGVRALNFPASAKEE